MTDTNVPAVVAEQKFTAKMVEGDCPALLRNLGKQITAHLERARKAEEKADQHRIAAAQYLTQARDLCDADGFDAFHEKFCPDLGRSRTYELLAIATGKNSIENVRASTRERVARHRAKNSNPLQSAVTRLHRSGLYWQRCGHRSIGAAHGAVARGCRVCRC